MHPSCCSASVPARWRSGDTHTIAPRHLPRQHQRLIAGAIDCGADARAVGHHDDAVGRIGARVTAAENRRPLCPAAISHCAIAATTGVLPVPPTERLPTLITGLARRRCRCGLAFDPPPPQPHHLAVKGIKQGV